VAIGRVGAATGMNAWIAQTLLPSTVPENMFVLAAFITFVSILIHLCFGSVIAVMGIVIPAMLAFTKPMGLTSIIPVMIAYTAINAHFILPFHNLAILVGTGEENGMYTEKETIKFGVPFTLVLFIITCVIEIPWWKVIGLW
jgi:di/tricarboxylate transporter